MICIGALKQTKNSSRAESIIERYAQNPLFGLSLFADGSVEKLIPIKPEDYYLVFRIFCVTPGGECGIFEHDKTEAALYISRLFTELSARDYECELFIGDENAAPESILTVSVLPYELTAQLFDCARDGACRHFVIKEDWRLIFQMDYIYGEKMERSTFRAVKPDDHEHCEFCWKTFSECPEDAHVGYSTEDRRSWVCDECYNDYKYIFGWERPYGGFADAASE